MSIDKPQFDSSFSDHKEQLSIRDIELLFTPNHIDQPRDTEVKKISQSFQKLTSSDYQTKLEQIAQNPQFRTLRKIFLTTFLISFMTIANYSDLHSGQISIKHHSKPTKIYQRQTIPDVHAHRPAEIRESIGEKLNSCEDVASVYQIVKNFKSIDGNSPITSSNMDASSYYNGNDYFDEDGNPVEFVATGKKFERGIDVAVDPEIIPYDSIIYVEYYDYRNIDLLDPVVKIEKVPGRNFDHVKSYLEYKLKFTKEKITIDIQGAKIFLGARLASDTGDRDFIVEDYKNTGEKRSLDISVGDAGIYGENISNKFGIQPKNGQPDDEIFFCQQILAKLNKKYKTKIPLDRVEINLHREMNVVIIPPDTLDHNTRLSILNHTRALKSKIEKDIVKHAGI